MESFRGLTNFISDIRYSQSKDEEIQRVETELAHIREQFVNPKKLDMYGRKKYALKLMYINILGYTVDFGHMEAMEILRSPKYADKSIGYLVLGCLTNENDELIRLVNQTLLTDLTSRSLTNQALALAFIGNNGNSETAEILANNVAKILMDTNTPNYITKKAALCLLHLFRKNPDVVQADTWIERLTTLLHHRDGGVLTSVLSLIMGFAQSSPDTFAALITPICSLLYKVLLEKYIAGDYMYDHIPAPWMLVKALRFLQLYPDVPDAEAKKQLTMVCRRILNTESKAFVSVDKRTKQITRHSAMLAVLLETVFLVVRMRLEAPLIERSVQHMRTFLEVSDADMRYLALEALQQLCAILPEKTGDDPEFVKLVDRLLVHPDISVRRRALDVMFEMCSQKNSQTIVEKLLKYLAEAEVEIKDEMVLKIAVLAEMYPVNVQWYIDVILHLLQTAGNNTPSEIWFRTVQIVSQHADMQPYAVSTAAVMLRTLNLPEPAVRICAYLCGEYIEQLQPGEMSGDSTPKEVVEHLIYHLNRTAAPTRAIIVIALSKIAERAERMAASQPAMKELCDNAKTALQSCSTSPIEEVQERSVELLTLLDAANHPGPQQAKAQATLAAMPAFPERQSLLLKGLKKRMKEGGGIDRSSHHLEGVKEDAPGDASDDEEGAGPAAPDSFAGLSAPAASAAAPPQQQEEEDLLGLGMSMPSTASAPITAESIQQSSQPAPVSSDPLSLLAMLSNDPTSQPAQAAPQQTAAQQPGEPVDPLFAALGISSAPTQSAAPVEVDAQQEMRYHMLLCQQEGVIFDDGRLSITCKHMYQGSQGKMQLTYANKTGAPINDLSASIPAPSADITIEAEAVATGIAPGGSAIQRILITAAGPFTDHPTMTLRYSTAGQSILTNVRIPCTAMQFFVPLAPPKQVFEQQWNAIPASAPLHQEATFLFQRQPFNPTTLQTFLAFMQGPAHMASLEGYDNTPQTLCFAAGMNCTRAGQNSMPLMVKLTMAPPPPATPQPGMITLTVKGCTDTLAIATKNSVFETLSKM